LVRAVVLLEAVPFGVSAEFDAWARSLTQKLDEAVAERGVEAVGETMIREVLGEWEGMPAELRDVFTANGAAILAETRGGELVVNAERLGDVDVPTLVVSAADSPAIFRDVAAVLETSIPNAKAVHVEGGHLIDPAHREVQAFVSSVLAR
jgi:hypothetical protein